MIISAWKNLWCLSACKKNRLHPSRVSRNNAKILWACYFGYFGHAWLHTSKVILSICRKLLCTQNISFIPDIFLEILQRCANFLFWILWACLATHTLKYHFVENFNVYLHAKKNFTIHFFLEILHFKDSCNLIGRQHFGPQLENQNFSRFGTSDEI